MTEADELAARRASQATPPVKAAARKRPVKRPPKSAMPFWKWMAGQHHHTDPAMRAAAEHIRSRWNFDEYYNHIRVLRVLTLEDSEHVAAGRRFVDEYATVFGIADEDRRLITGVRGAWFPFAPDLCDRVDGSGRRCQREAIPGAGKCARHGGQWISDEDRGDVSRQVHDRLGELSMRATRVIEDLLDHGRSEKVRLEAAIAVLDRAGAGGSSTVKLELGGEDAAEAVRARLESLRASIIEGEIVAPEPEAIEG